MVHFNFLTIDKLLSLKQEKLCSTFRGHGYGVYDIFPQESFVRRHQQSRMKRPAHFTFTSAVYEQTLKNDYSPTSCDVRKIT